MFDPYDDRHCIDCANAKYKETFDSGHRMYVCGKHKAAVTYNEYFLKNRYVFKNNIPEDLREELEILK